VGNLKAELPEENHGLCQAGALTGQCAGSVPLKAGTGRGFNLDGAVNKVIPITPVTPQRFYRLQTQR